MARELTTRKRDPGAAAHLRVVTEKPGSGCPDFDALFKRYSGYVAAVSLRLLGSDGDVDDVVQEVFWDCSRKIHKIKDQEHARRWLVQVTVRKCRRLLRKQKVLSLIHLPLSRSLDPPAPGASAEERVAIIQLFSLLETLPVNQRLAWSLRHLEGAALQEVAEACGCSLATVKRWIGAAHAVITGGAHG